MSTTYCKWIASLKIWDIEISMIIWKPRLNMNPSFLVLTLVLPHCWSVTPFQCCHCDRLSIPFLFREGSGSVIHITFRRHWWWRRREAKLRLIHRMGIENNVPDFSLFTLSNLCVKNKIFESNTGKEILLRSTPADITVTKPGITGHPTTQYLTGERERKK